MTSSTDSRLEFVATASSGLVVSAPVAIEISSALIIGELVLLGLITAGCGPPI